VPDNGLYVACTLESGCHKHRRVSSGRQWRHHQRWFPSPEIEGLFDIAKADGKVAPAEAAYLAEVARLFGLSSARFERAKAAALGIAEREACTILGADPLATDEQIRAAWLRLVRANHPDRLLAQGLPQEAVALANRKLAAINDAYDRLKRERALASA
jgi:DnaJ like chaperone protein